MSWYSSTLNQRYRSRTLTGDGRVVLDEPDGELEHVLEVDPAGPLLGGLVASVQRREQPAGQRAVVAVGFDRLLVGLGSDPAGLRPLDLRRQVADRDVPVAARQAPGQVDDEGDLRRHDRRQLGAGHPRPEVAELAERRRVERRGDDPGSAERGQPLAHLAGGLVGERHDEDVLGATAPVSTA